MLFDYHVWDKLCHIHGEISNTKIANPKITYPGITCFQTNNLLFSVLLKSNFQ